MVLLDGLGDRLQQRRLSGPRGRDNQAALALADGRQELHDPGVEVLRIAILEQYFLVRIQRRELLEMDVAPLVDDDVRKHEVDGLDLDQGEVFLPVLGRPDDARNGVSGAQLELADLGGRNVDIVLAGKIAEFGGPQEPEAVFQALQDAFGEEQSLLFGLGFQDLENQIVFVALVDIDIPFGQADLGGDLEDLLGLLILELNQAPVARGLGIAGQIHFAVIRRQVAGHVLGVGMGVGLGSAAVAALSLVRHGILLVSVRSGVRDGSCPPPRRRPVWRAWICRAFPWSGRASARRPSFRPDGFSWFG